MSNQAASWWDNSFLGSNDKQGNAIGGSALDNFGTVAEGIGSLGSLYASFQGAKNAKKTFKLAEQDSKFSHQMDLAGVAQAIDNENRKKSFFGNTNLDSINNYIPQATLDQYGQGNLGNQSNNQGYQGFSGQQPQQGAPKQLGFNSAPQLANPDVQGYGGFAQSNNVQQNIGNNQQGLFA